MSSPERVSAGRRTAAPLADRPGAAAPLVDRPETAAPLAERAARRLGRTLVLTALTLAVTCGIWQGCISVFHLSPFVAKGPLEVYRFLFSDPGDALNRSQLGSALLITFRDAGLGYLAGTVVATGVALAVVLRREVEQTFMPIAIALRSVPLVAMVPLLTLIFGQGLLAVVIIAGIVTFFPTLVNVAAGLRSAPSQSFDLMAAYGASELTVLRKVQLPYALPSIFASARIAAPGALLGAILAEWLATGEGLGNLMVRSSSTAQYAMLWSAVVCITLVSVLVYNLVSAIERPAVARFGVGHR